MGAVLTSETQSAFLGTLTRRRTEVLAALRDFGAAEPLARCVQEFMLDAARKGRTSLDPADAQARLEAADIPLDAPLIDDHSPRALFAQPATHGQTISALLAEGLRLQLSDLAQTERRDALSTLTKLLPGIERLGPFVISDFVDAALTESDAALFWQVYVDRVVAEVKRRTRKAKPPKEPWMLLALLRVHRAGPGKSGAPAWENLRLHINRALQAARHRWRFIRQLAEDSNDVELLHFLCGSAAMVDDPETLESFLERGNPRLISCALFTLQVRGGHRGVVERIVTHLAARPLPEIGGRLVEMYAQLHALPERTPALEQLAAGVRRIVQTQVAQGVRVDSLLEAVSDDPRALRQSILLAHAVPSDVRSPSPQVRHLLERVIGVWFQAFTPGGVAHPFNDEIFRRAVRKAVVAGVDDATIERYVAFAANLGPFAKKWAKGPDDWRRIKKRFVWAYAQLVLPLAGELAERAGGGAAAAQLYRALVRLYLDQPDARGAGWLGAVESVVPAMFADLLAGDPAEARVDAAAALVAEVEAELRGVSPSGDANATHADDAIERPVVRAAVRLADRSEATVPSILATCTGWAALRDLGRRVRRLFGWRDHGEAMVAGDTLLVRAGSARRGETLSETVERISLDALTSLQVRRPLLGLHVVAGVSALVGAAAYGGQLAFAGIRSADTPLALAGVGIIGGGLIFDAAAQALARRAREKVLVSLAAGGAPVIIEVDTRAGSELLDSLMAADARRRELALYASLSSKDTAWGGEPDDPARGDEPADADANAASTDEEPAADVEAGADVEPIDEEPAAAVEPADAAPDPAPAASADPDATSEPEDQPASEADDPAAATGDSTVDPGDVPDPDAPLPALKSRAGKTLPSLPKRLRPKADGQGGPPRDVDRE